MKKLAALVCLSVGLFSLFPDDAQAQKRKGNTYSQMGQNDADIFYQFNLVDTKKDGSLIEDSDKSKEDIGLFYGAIEQYKSGVIGIACSTTLDTAYGSLILKKPDVFENSTCGQAIRNTNPKLDDSDKYYLDANDFLILLTKNEIEQIGLPSINTTLFDENFDLKAQLIVDEFGNDTISYSIFKPGNAEAIQNYRLSLSTDFDFEFDSKKAINDLTYILGNNLFSKSAIFEKSEDDTITLRRGVLLQNRFESNSTTIPESGSTPNVLATIMLGAILFSKKHKLSNNNK